MVKMLDAPILPGPVADNPLLARRLVSSLRSKARLKGQSAAAEARRKSADAWTPKIAKRLRNVLLNQIREAARRVREGQPDIVTESMKIRWAADLEQAKRGSALEMVRDGMALARMEFGEEQQILGRRAMSLSALRGKLDEPIDEYLHRARVAEVESYINATSKLETEATAKRLDRIYKDAEAYWDDELKRGMTPREMAAEINRAGLGVPPKKVGRGRRTYNLDARKRSVLMAQTLSHWAYNEGAHQTYKDMGVTAEAWDAAEDGITCFPSGVKVTMADGSRCGISEVKVGDRVMTISGSEAVVKVHEREYEGELVSVTVCTGHDPKGYKICRNVVCTPEHPFITVLEDGMREAKDLTSGTILYLDDATFGIVDSTAGSNLPGPIKVYNLTVENIPVYYANGILVHNCEFCVQLDGRIVSVDDSFVPAGTEFGGAAGGRLKIPEGIDVIHSPLHPHCRCTTVAVFFPEDAREIMQRGDRMREDFKERVDSGEWAEDRRRRARKLRKDREKK